ncbi:MAG: hypothetical protein ABJA83_04915 [Burkholderiaceae bacterium]
MRILLLTGVLVAFPAAAGTFSDRYPAGSINDVAQAQAALKEADAEMKQIAQSARARDAECYRGVLVNSCRDKARREKELAEREVKRVQIEAHSLKRRLDAEQLAKRRAEKAQAQATDKAQRELKGEAARAETAAREADLKRREALGTKGGVGKAHAPAKDRAKTGSADGSQPRKAVKVSPQDPQRAPDRLSASDRSDNALKFQQKQAQAKKHAQQQDAERKKNEQRRAERRKQIEQAETEREAVRKKAAESK